MNSDTYGLSTAVKDAPFSVELSKAISNTFDISAMINYLLDIVIDIG